MSEKCFCHLNGYKVKDADARAQLSAHDVAIKGLSEGITELSEKVESGAGGGSKLYLHTIECVAANGDRVKGYLYSTNETSYTKTDLINVLPKAYNLTISGYSYVTNMWFGEAKIVDISTAGNYMSLVVYAYLYDFSFSAQYIDFEINGVVDTVTEV